MDKLKKYLRSFGFDGEEIAKLFAETDAQTIELARSKLKDLGRTYILSLGFSEAEADRIMEKSRQNVNLMKSRVEGYKELFHLNETELRKVIFAQPTLLNLDTSGDSEVSVNGKIRALKELLDLSDAEVRKMFVSFPTLLCYDINSEAPTSVKSKIKFYKEILGLSDSEIRKMIINNPELLGHDIKSENKNSIKSKIETYKEIFNLSDRQIRKMIISDPKLLSFDLTSESETSVRGKARAYKELLGLSDSEIQSLVVNTPQMLNYDVSSDRETSIKNKLKDYKIMLGVNDEELKNMIIALPVMLCFDLKSDKNTSLKTKVKKMREILPQEEFKEQVTKRPYILGVPAQSFKIRYMLSCIADKKSQFFTCGFLTNEKKAWARYCYLKKANNDCLWYIYTTEQRIQKLTGASSDELMERYPLDEVAIEEIEKAYLEKTGERLVLDKEEREQLGLGE